MPADQDLVARNSRPVLVAGATGLQGGAVVTALLAAHMPVRALVRDPTSPAARALAARGVDLAKGDFADAASLTAAMRGVAGVFSVQLPPTDPADPHSEVRAGQALIDAARSAGVATFVQTSVARAGDQCSFAGWNEGRWWNAYWDSKSAVIDAVEAAGFPFSTLLKPAYMMDNFSVPATAALLYPGLDAGRIVTALNVDTRLDLICADDVGRFAAAAFVDPERFGGRSIDLAAEALTMTEVAAILQDVLDAPVAAISLSAADAVAAGLDAAVVQSYEWDNVEGYRVDIEALTQYGIALTSFRAWAERHRHAIVVRRPSS